jgi:ATP-dependent RNA helicase RhlE
LVIQVKEEIENFSKYLSIRTIGIYGGVNIKRQSIELV